MRGEILIVGAGPIGLAVAKAFGEAGIAHRIAEATDHVGGNWAHGVYSTAHIISSRRTTEYSDYPMPAAWPDFPSAAQMYAYYDAYADHFGIRERIRFGATVAEVRPAADGWEVTYAGGEIEPFKGVAICNGHHWAKDLPAWTSDFAGKVLHSKDYRHPDDDLRDRRVLVLGGGNSGCDIVSEAARVSTSADWSLRRQKVGAQLLRAAPAPRPSPGQLHGRSAERQIRNPTAVE